MTVPTLNSVAEFATNGVTTNFPFFFKFLANEDLVVTYVNPEGVSAVLTYGSQYTVNGAGDEDGGSIVTTTALAGPGQLVVSREMDAYQQTSLRNQGKFLAETHEDVFDKLTMLIQQGFSIFKRALVRPYGRDYYDAEGRRIANVADPVDAQDAATKESVEQYVAGILETGQGPINNADNIVFAPAGGVVTTVGNKLRELVSVTNYNGSLRNALATGAMVRVPATVSTLSLSAADSPFVLPNLYRVSAEGDLTINLEAGVHTTATGDMCRVGVRNSTIKLDGVTPTETKATAVTAITGTAGDWSITYNLVSAAGVEVGDFAKLFDVGPLPILMGDNAASTILRNYPLMGELYNPARVNAGSATISQGGASISFAGVGANFLTSMLPGDLFTIKGQTEVLATVTAGAATISGVWANGGVASSTAFYVTRANAGTIGTGGVASATVTGVGSSFLTQGNIGDVLLVRGQMVKIIGIASDLSLTLDKTINIANGSPYSILQSAAALHGGVHEVTAVSGNQVTLRNRCTPKPPINGVSVDEFRIIKTILKQSGTGDGFVFDQNGSLREVNNVVITGPGNSSAPVGILLQSRVPSETSEGGVSFGDVTQHGLRGTALFGENVGVTRFGRGAMVGHGCLLNARKVAFTNNLEIGVWALEASIANLRRCIITSGSNGLNVNPGATAKVTEMIACGCGGDGIRTEAGAVVYGEGPASVANEGMNYRILDSHLAHFTDGVSLLAGLSGFYLAGGSARLDREVVGASSRSGIEMVEDAHVMMDKGWVSGTSNTGGQGFGVNLGNGCRFSASNTSVRANNSTDIFVSSAAIAAEATLLTCHYGTFAGVDRLNSPTGKGNVVWDGAESDTGSSVPTISSSGGAIGSVTAVGLNWTRDKDRYEFDARVTVTTVGAGSGYLTMTLPFTAAANTAVTGINQSTGVGITGYANGTELRLFSAAGAFPAANGNILLVSGVVRV
ncbi:phage tail fiber protein [Pseudomonas mediterranea]|uniref:phage tail fiber domain-containing protein n=1 Tax=Pseudomonas mediterranea TaxID=183795 RepID=UPI001331094F|nr:phage tail fiber protein [Pseudomonas mediterranea]